MNIFNSKEDSLNKNLLLLISAPDLEKDLENLQESKNMSINLEKKSNIIMVESFKDKVSNKRLKLLEQKSDINKRDK